MIRLPLTIDELSAIAFGRSRRSSTISLTNACRAGVSNELMTPWITCSQMICATVMRSVNVSDGQDRRLHERGDLCQEQDPASIHPIDEDAGKRGDDERRNLPAEAGDAQQQLRTGEPVDEPARGDARDPGADKGNALAAKEETEVTVLQGARQAQPRVRRHRPSL